MVSLTRIGYSSLTNFTNILTKFRVTLKKEQCMLYHCSLYLQGPGREIKMPSLSPTMVEGKILKWLKKEGDVITPGDVICDIETDKAVVTMEMEEEGILAKILIPENTGNIKVGSLIALMVDEGEDWKAVDIPLEKSSSSGVKDPEEVSPEPGSNGSITIPVTMPSLSPTMTSGTIVKWLKSEGDLIVPGDVLCDIQTDKAIMSLDTEEEGILAKILVPNDTKDVKVGTLIALIVPEGGDWKNVKSAGESVKSELPKSEASKTYDGRGISFGPAVKALLATYQIQPEVIKPTGKGNRLLKEDVLNYINDNKIEKKALQKGVSISVDKIQERKQSESKAKEKSASPPPARAPKYTDIEISNMRKTIANRLLQSKRDIPHSYAVAKCKISNLLKAKDSLATDVRVTMNDLLTKSTATALQIYPKANSLFINNEIKRAENFDVCVAVATDFGLFTPVIKSTNLKSVTTIASETQDLIARAKIGKLKPEEYFGGTFTISNLGMFGIKQFLAIINPPQCGILAFGNVSATFDSEMNIEKHIIVSLSYDRRAMDESEAAEFMETLKYVIENPKLILMGSQSSPTLGL